jgi:hypothetical protein
MTGAESIDLSTTRGQERTLVAVIALAAGVIAAVAPAEPTGTPLWDIVLKFCFGVTLVIAGARAPRWTPMVFAAVAAGLSGVTIWAAIAWIGLLAALATAMLQRRSRLLGAFAVALALQALLRLPAFGFFGLPSLVAGVISIVLLGAGYQYSSRLARKRVRWAIAGLAVAVFAIGIAGSLTLLGARGDVERGVAAAQRGLDAARQGDTDLVVAELGVAERALVSAEDTASGPLGQGLRLLPIAAQHHRAVQVATAEGALIAREATAAVREADLGTISLRAGQVDLDALRAMAPRLRSTATALEAGAQRISAARSGWLVPAVRDRVDELLVEVEELLPEATRAADAADVVPRLLGSDVRQSYFVIFGTPAEARGLGGLLGSWAIITADQGRLSIADSGRIGRLYDVAASNIVPDGLASDWYLEMARPTTWPQNLTSSPNFSTVADVSQAVLAGASERQIDGYIYLDTWALIDLMKLSGPVDIPFQEAPLSAENAPQFFFEDQYRIEDISRTELFDTLAVVAGAVLNRLAGDVDLPGPEELGRVLGPAARAGRLQMITFDEQANDFLTDIRLLRPFGDSPAADFIGLVHSNSTASKLDLYLERELLYRVSVGADGAVVGSATVTLRSVLPADAPAYTLQEDGTGGVNRPLVSLYSSNALAQARLDGQAADIRVASEYGLGRYLVETAVPPTGEPVVAEYDLSGQIDPSQPYTLEIWHQPLVNTDRVRVEYTGPDGSFVWEDDLVENVILSSAELVE